MLDEKKLAASLERARRRIRLDSYMDRLLVLRTFAQFDQLPPEQLSATAAYTRPCFFPAGTEIHAEGQPVTELYYIIRGRVEMRRNGKAVYETAERSVVGGLAALSESGNSQQSVALEDTTALVISGADQLQLFAENFGTLVMVLGRVAYGVLEARMNAGPGAGFASDIEHVPQPAGELTVVDKLVSIERSFAFASARLEAMMELAEHARERRAPAGTVLWRQGERASSWLLVVAGVVAGQREAQSFRLGPASVAGGLETLALAPRWYNASAETDIMALEMSHDHVLDVLEDNVDMAIGLLRALGTELLAMRDRTAS